MANPEKAKILLPGKDIVLIARDLAKGKLVMKFKYIKGTSRISLRIILNKTTLLLHPPFKMRLHIRIKNLLSY